MTAARRPNSSRSPQRHASLTTKRNAINHPMVTLRCTSFVLLAALLVGFGVFSVSKAWFGISSSSKARFEMPGCKSPELGNVDDYEEQWFIHHANLVRDAKLGAERGVELVMIGDSITERWRGTSHFGVKSMPEFKEVFESYFIKASGGTIEALALGTSGDTSPNLLWHLQNGMLPESLSPKVWMVMIGTNDLGRTLCSKGGALRGMLKTIDYLHNNRPTGAQFLIHGLLPRSDDHVGGNRYLLGKWWDDIQWINSQIREKCDQHDNWHYMESPDLFLKSTTTLNHTTMEDMIHPTAEGYRLWGQRIVPVVRRILDET